MRVSLVNLNIYENLKNLICVH